MFRIGFLVVAWSLLLLVSCKSNHEEAHVNNTLFEMGKALCVIHDDAIEEASGLAVSRSNPGLLWTHNDSGDKSRLFLIDTAGNIKATVWIDSARNRDWEDIAIGPGPVEGKTYLYIADIGDNEAEHRKKYIYRIEEPTINVSAQKDTILQKVDVIIFQYPDGLRDAESLMLDPVTKDLFVISKRELKANIYRLPYPQSTTEMITAELVIRKREFDKFKVDTIRSQDEVLIRGYHPKYFYQIVAADISPDGSEVLVKSYSAIYYWKREPLETISDLLLRSSIELPYDPEPQGEAITFDPNGKGYYTLNEKMRGMDQRLTFHKRK
jgi:hypothetical protein